MSTEQGNAAAGEVVFETRDFYLACYLRSAAYNLLDMRAEGRRKVFVFRDRPMRRQDVLPFYPLALPFPRSHSHPPSTI